MPSQKERYEELSRLSSHMVEAARSGDWNTLSELEQRVCSLKVTTESDTEQNFNLTYKRDLILNILAADAEVRRFTEPWMEVFGHFMGDQGRQGMFNETGTDFREGQERPWAACHDVV